MACGLFIRMGGDIGMGGPDMAPQVAQAKGATPPSDSPGQRSAAPRGTRGAPRSPFLRGGRGVVVVLVVVGVGMLGAGCAGGAREGWAKPGATAVTRLAVLPFENQTPALRAGAAATDLVVSELVAAGRFAVMEPSETADLIRRESLDPGDATRLLSAQRLGRLLGVSHVLQGAVVEYRYKPGLSETPVVGITARVVEVATGDVVWTASHARSGSTWFCEQGLARVSQAIAHYMAVHLASTLNGRAK